MTSRLNVVPFPEPHEQLPAFIARTAHQGGLGVRDIYAAAGLDFRAIDNAELYGVRLSRATRLRLSAATGVSEARLDAMTLQTMEHRALSPNAFRADLHGHVPATEREWAFYRRSRACPQCLAQNGGIWQQHWRLGVVCCCPEHRTLMLETCPGCGASLGHGKGNVKYSLRGLMATRHPSACGLPSSDGPGGCSFRLDIEGSAAGVGCRLPTLRAQMRVLRALNGGPPLCHGHAVTSLAYLNDLRTLLRVLAAVGLPDMPALTDTERQTLSDHGLFGRSLRKPVRAVSSRFVSFAVPPVAVLAVLLPIAADIVEKADCRDEAVQLLRRCRDAHPQQQQLRQLQTVGLQNVAHHALKDRARITYQLQFNEYRALTDRARPYGYSAAHVPPRLNDALFEPFATLTAPFRSANVRLLVPVLLVMLCQHRHWQPAINALGTEQLVSPTSCGYLLTQLRKHELLDDVLSAVHAIASQLERNGAIDYHRQRQKLQELEPISERRWGALARSAGIRTGRDGTRRLVASAWLWQELTQSDPRLASTWRHHPLEHAHPRIVVLMKNFVAGPLPYVLNDLRTLAREIALQHDVRIPSGLLLDPAREPPPHDAAEVAKRHRVAPPVSLTAADRLELQRRADSSDHRTAKRARIVLLASDGASNSEIVDQIAMGRDPVSMWRRRFNQLGLDGLRDRRTSTRPPHARSTVS